MSEDVPHYEDLKHPDLGPFAMVEDYDYQKVRSVFNSASEEERYQAFKARLMRELIARNVRWEEGSDGYQEARTVEDISLVDRHS